MMRLLPLCLGFLLLVGQGGTALAASAKATALRQANGLTAFTPPEKFLAGNFVADEMNPGFIQKDGELLATSPEAVLRLDLKIAPIYDLSRKSPPRLAVSEDLWHGERHR